MPRSLIRSATICVAICVGVCVLSETAHGSVFAAADKLVFMKRYHEAIEKINEVLSKEPNNPTALAILGKAQFHLSLFKAATATFEKTIKFQPGKYTNWSAPFLARLAFWLSFRQLGRASEDRRMARSICSHRPERRAVSGNDPCGRAFALGPHRRGPRGEVPPDRVPARAT